MKLSPFVPPAVAVSPDCAHHPAPSAKIRPDFGVRIAEVAALADDGRVVARQRRIPTLPEFDRVFAAFAQGTLLQSKQQYIAIEDLRPGDVLKTAEGTFEQVTWIGSTLFAPRDSGARLRLTRIMADSFGMNRPENSVCLGPAARVLQTPPDLRNTASPQQLMSPVNRFLDGVNVIETMPPSTIRLFHIGLRNHGAVIANGLQIESFHPGTDPVAHFSQTLRDAYLSLFPHVEHLSAFGSRRYPSVSN